MSFIQIFIQIIYLKHAFCFNLSPGKPLPHADELSRILSNTLFANASDFSSNSVFQYLFGDDDNNATDWDVAETTQDLDISILDPETLSRIVQAARQKELLFKPSRRHEAYHYEPHLINKSIEFMRQSIYDTRRRLIVTKPIRKKYQLDVSYNIGILYGALMQLRIKIDNVYSALKNMRHWYGFLWYLFLYQRCVALNVDIDFSVQRMFMLQKKWQGIFRDNDEEDYDYEARGDRAESIHEIPADGANEDVAPPDGAAM